MELTRRQFLKGGTCLAGAALVAPYIKISVLDKLYIPSRKLIMHPGDLLIIQNGVVKHATLTSGINGAYTGTSIQVLPRELGKISEIPMKYFIQTGML